jgi:anthraniloyl-CoA monooxygenase
MKTICIGGGPASLYYAILQKKRDPSSDVVVYERNKPDDTFGFGVVFSDKTLEGLGVVDPESYAAICGAFRHWDDIDVFIRGEKHTSRGHGFSGIGRQRLLSILAERAREVGVRILYETEIAPGAAALGEADLVVVADGVNSAMREHYRGDFQPDVELRPHRFVWLGTTFPFDAFTFYFRENDHGLFQVHAYRYEEGRSTFIVECSDAVFRRTGLAIDDEGATKAYMERLFAAELAGHPLLVNRSIWRQFPVITNRRWVRENMVLLGDAAHTAHFSIGSGTKLALEDAIALSDALVRSEGRVSEALAAYDRDRRPTVASIQRAAQVSLEWFENTERHVAKEPLHFTFSLLTRSLRVTHENLEKRDPEFVRAVDADFAKHTGGDPKTPPMFHALRLRERVVPNRVAVSPMCMYSADDGTPTDFHLVHLGSRALGGAGLVMTEMTDISREGRITTGCTGMYDEKHVAAWRRITDFIHRESPAIVGLQLGHAGRKGATRPPWEGQDVALPPGEDWELLAPSALPWSEQNKLPREMTERDLATVKEAFVRATEQAARAGFDLLELHCAHGYLLSTFLSPLTNRRTDAYGGSIENRMRYPLAVFEAMRAAWPKERPMSVRVSASDWAPGGTTPEELVTFCQALKAAGCDLVDVSSGSVVVSQQPRYGRLYQVPFAELVRSEVGLPVAAVGNISSYTDVNTVLCARRADLCFLARAHLFDPYWTRHAAQAQGHTLPWPMPYGVLAGYNPRLA